MNFRESARGLILLVLLFFGIVPKIPAKEKHYRTFQTKGTATFGVDHFQVGGEIMSITLLEDWFQFDGKDKLLFQLKHRKIPDYNLNFWVVGVQTPPEDADSAAKVYQAEVEKLEPPKAITGSRPPGAAPTASFFPLSYFLAPSDKAETCRVITFFTHGNSVFGLDITFGKTFTYELRKNYDDMLTSISFEKPSQ